jgi:exopolysaccharide production protein ExoY
MLILPQNITSTRESPDATPVGGVLKRGFDIVVALNALVIAAPLMLVVFVLIRLTSPGPGFFVHRRIGHNGRDFGCIKFRTMAMDADAVLNALLVRDPGAASEFAATAKLRDDPRIVPGIGRLLRRTSLDELPQFFNVLKGDMSLIGPRPVTRQEIERHYAGRARDVLNARPGMSGLWQVSGRNGLSYAERVRLDLEYVRDWGFRTDVSILLRTVRVVLLGRVVLTMPPREEHEGDGTRRNSQHIAVPVVP